MDKLKILIDFAKLPLQKQIVITLAAFIISNGLIAGFFLNRETTKELEYNLTIKTKDAKIDKLQNDNTAIWKYHSDYVDKKENEYQNILIQLDKIKNK